ncbi:baseplate assembly protein [Enterobacter bugandensis]|uniref:baseplate assembly protein n=1 Tax=Enterobacter bugandensis TaxID=881260 RepID=UPI0021D1BF86|nr:baseplate J/gp47 family protein [Enterobacter bugandensis]MCU6214436.1 baseplate J/gp47 family protein [Enterobacter bugandensis]
MTTTIVQNSIVKTIDMSLLPPPAFVQTPLFSDVKNELITELQTLDETFDALLESDPAMKMLEIVAYWKIINTARVNQGQLAVLLAFAKGDDLTQLGANLDCERMLITPADPDAIPPVTAVYESDDEYRHRIQLSWYARNTAGSTNAYNYFALSCDPDVLSAQAYGPPVTQPGYVDMYILSRTGDGTPSQALLDKVTAALNPDDTRPLTDFVTVKAASNLNYSIEATIIAGLGPDQNVLLNGATSDVETYTAAQHRIGATAAISGIYDAIHRDGTERVILTVPAADIIAGVGQAPYCTGIKLSVQMG